MDDDDFAAQREAMVASDIAARGVRDPAVLAAMRSVPREEFVAPGLRERAYDDSPLPIEARQTISQPYIVALMAEAARLGGTERVLEVGAGSGYASAILARIAAQVFAIERHQVLADLAAARLYRLGFRNVELRCGDGSAGWPEAAPFDAILVAAGGPSLPRSLLAQLAEGGRLVMPVGPGSHAQRLVRATRVGAGFREDDLGGVVFVPLIGKEGWPEADD